MKRLQVVGVCLALLATTPLIIPALAQPRDAGFKLRGDIGRPSGARATRSVDRTLPQSVARATGGLATATDIDEDRAFAFEPLNIARGDTVTVASSDARLMRGRSVVGALSRGQKLKVLCVHGPWIGTQIETERGTMGGWIWHGQISRADSAR